jgi:NADH:ubiquinone oxidoreductase subunit 5 (subunit L)/multisubunit Na+/H+ antiporter MnhA subunit
MEAPIPASALIHSATLVSAGVYLILRLAPYHQYSYTLVYPLTILSLITICVGGLASCVQNDLKKILAYSTISNCGFMVLFAASNKESLCFLYFALHGIFKAAAFFIIGTIVVVSKHKQDWRCANLPITHRKPLLLILLPTVALLGAWPGSITGVVKHMNVDLVTHPYLAVPTQWVTHIGTITSIIYSVKIVTLLLQYENIKQTNEGTVGTHVEQQVIQIGILILLGTFISFCGLSRLNLTSLYLTTNNIEFKNITLGLISSSLLPLLILSYCFWSRKKNQIVTYTAVLMMLLVQML